MVWKEKGERLGVKVRRMERSGELRACGMRLGRFMAICT